jgi:hypothetical protein
MDTLYMINHTNGVMVSVLASSAVDRGFEQTKDCKIGICCFSAKHAALRRKGKDWFARNQNNVSEWSDKNVYQLTVVSVS